MKPHEPALRTGRRITMKIGLRGWLTATLALGTGLAVAAGAAAQTTGTPSEMVATYGTLADGILALKRTEENLVKSILGAALGHGQATLAHAQKAIAAGDAKGAQAATQALAAVAGELATEGDNAVGAVRKRLLEGGHHHNAAGEAQGIYDEGYVVVTRAAKAKLLESSRAIAAMAAAPKAEALAAEWKKVEEVTSGLLKSAH
jgi:hypothetical protein